MPRTRCTTPKALTYMPVDIIEMAKVVAPLFGLRPPEFLGEILRPILEQKRREAVKMLAKYKPCAGRCGEQ